MPRRIPLQSIQQEDSRATPACWPECVSAPFKVPMGLSFVGDPQNGGVPSKRDPEKQTDPYFPVFPYSLPEFMNFKLFGKTISVVNIKLGLFLGHPLSQ